MTGITTTGPRSFRNLGRAGLVAMAALALVSRGGKSRPKADLAASRGMKTTRVGGGHPDYLVRAAPPMGADGRERMKVTVTILDQDLRADALRVAASRQVSQNGLWADAPVQAATVQKLEDIILTKARDLRRNAVK